MLRVTDKSVFCKSFVLCFIFHFTMKTTPLQMPVKCIYDVPTNVQYILIEVY